MVNAVDFYNEIYTKKPTKWAVPWRNQVAFNILSKHINNPETMLDVGCGNGHTIEYFKLWWPDTIYIGVDLSDVAIDLARKKVPTADFRCGVFEEMSLPRCDVVTVMGVAEHFENLDKSLALLGDIGDLIYMECPNCLLSSGTPGEGFRYINFGAKQKEWHLERDTWERYLKDAGLEILQSLNGLQYATEFIWILRKST